MAVILPSELYSQAQLGAVLAELRQYGGLLRDRAVRQKVTQVDEPAPELSDLTAKALRANRVVSADSAAVEVLLYELENMRPHIPVAHIMLAAIPSDVVRSQLMAWLREQIHPQLLVSLAARPDIGGGIVLQVGSRRYDLSYRTQLLQNKPHIIEVLRRAGV